MSYRAESASVGEDGRKPGEPHPDSQANLEFALFRIRDITFINGMECFFTDVDPKTGIIKTPKTISFFWEVAKSKHGFPISFHQSRDKFKIMLERTLMGCQQKGYINRQNDKRINPYK